MKKRIAFMMAMVMVLSTSFTTYAANTSQGDGLQEVLEEGGYAISENDTVSDGNDLQENDTVSDGDDLQKDEELADEASLESVSSSDVGSGQEPQPEIGDMGQIDLSIAAALILNRPVEFLITLTDLQNTSLTDTITMDENVVEESRVSFENLPEGDYVLTVTARGFAPYSQTISVKGKAYEISLATGFLGGINYASGAVHPGVLLIGDVNGDGRVDEADGKLLVDDIDSGKGGENDTADLNGDGKINLVDLEYYAKGYDVTEDTQAGIQTFVPAVAILPTVAEGTRAEGDLEALLRNRSDVILTPAEGGSISEQNPVALEFDFAESSGADADGILIETGGDNPISSAVISLSYVDENGEEGEMEVPVTAGVQYLLKQSEVLVEQDSHGNIIISLGGQVALKKVTLTITGMKNNNNLAEISKVEFVNGMEDRIPEPEMDCPENLTAAEGNKRISLNWDSCVNITGYEVLIQQGNQQETVLTAAHSLDIVSFGGKELTNYLEYRIQVQSINGTWRSGYCDEVTAVPKPSGKPDKPDNVSAAGQYQSVAVSWKDMKDTVSYNLYYKESTEDGYQKIEGIKGNSYRIEGLKDLTEYTVYVTGVNEFGESGPSLAVAATTTDLNPAEMPKYNLINVGQEGEVGDHIINATMTATMKDSPLDVQAGTAWGTVDHDPSSYYLKNSWDDGGYNYMDLGKGLTYEFDQAYKIDTIAFYDLTSRDTGYFYAKVRYWDENGKQTDVSGVSLQRKTDAEGRIYYVLKLPQPVNAKKLQFGLGRYSASGTITISEVYFYYYDTLMDEIMSLYEDDLHTVLREDVTQADIDALRIKINTLDEVSGEYHPDRTLLERELQTAEAILNDAGLNASVEIHSGITTDDVNRGFGGLNAWQPLGVIAAAEEEIMVYVGHNTKRTGEATNLQLVSTQYHAESDSVSKVVVNLKVGANKVTVPKIWTVTGVESGGALYIQYTGSNTDDRYAVRVSGGVQVPVLDLYQVTDAEERLARVETYVEELQTYVRDMEKNHEVFHVNSGNVQVAYPYDNQNCILGASDILLNTMLFSLPAQQILQGAGNGSTQEQARKILASMDAMEEMMNLFYQHKGLSNSAPAAVDQIPKGHLNIRYQRMFSGAFMYASGNHIGIEWGSTSGMVTAVPVMADSEGRYLSGSYFGWGIAHEIGHCINQNTYAIAEITNNYFAVLAQAKDRNDSVRFQYDNVYKKVTSGARGRSSNVFTQLGMYWQLHLAYDTGYNYKVYEDYQEQLDNLFFARVDTYARDTSKAPAPKGVALTLTGNRDQDLMRLACAAAKKNILEFFERWGMVPDEDTCRYAEQFDVETRAIYYVNDDARVYSLQGSGSALGTSGDKEAVGSVTAVVNAQRANQVDFTLDSTLPQAKVLGYEIVRCMITGGEVQKEAVGFVTGDKDTFSDTVTANNRMVWYEITVIDKYLNRSAVKILEPMKIQHDGSLDKAFWTVETLNLTVEDAAQGTGTEDSPCEPKTEDPALRLIDNLSTAYTATVEGEAEIVLDFHKTLTVTGFKYTGLEGISGSSYEIQAYTDSGWIKVAEGSLGQEKSDTLYFTNEDGKYVSTYAASAVKLILKAQNSTRISIEELDVLGVTGDNADFRRAEDNTVAIGKLSADYQYGTGTNDVIPAGSVVFTGSYKGNPAYNVVILYDQEGNIVGGVTQEGELKAQQIILADVPAQGNIQNVSDGTWIYWIEPQQQVNLTGITKVRAELYRVNNALTNEGQRLVSDSLFENMPAVLPEIQINKN
ncbi:MAG: M60 family metallopeptidase [Candidatus Gastranaerophilales bacterium]|nr:M60 family metallopeptidase [Candidatus Gastranaerophilales bacterium]